ncbi:hypothetical protein ACFPVY_02380 [Flavobacterium qiangtangense]|uniref:Recombinase domain-containing protein n=1 Tax=Flavobacterium qiangtangense TaxID=1442595 RepID=A0ABW1PK81_9FLAO
MSYGKDFEQLKTQRAVVPRQLLGMDLPLSKNKEIPYGTGFDRKGNMAIDRVLTNPVYGGLVRVGPFKDLPGGLFMLFMNR